MENRIRKITLLNFGIRFVYVNYKENSIFIVIQNQIYDGIKIRFVII